MIAAYWKQRNEREQWMLIAGGIIGITYLFYVLIYAPLTSSVFKKTIQLREKRSTLIWMKQIQHQYAQTNQVAPKVGTTELLSLIASQLQQPNFQTYPYEMKQTSSGDIEIHFDKVPYNTMIQWLQKLTQHYQTQIQSLRFEQTNTPGVVQCHLLISI